MRSIQIPSATSDAITTCDIYVEAITTHHQAKFMQMFWSKDSNLSSSSQNRISPARLYLLCSDSGIVTLLHSLANFVPFFSILYAYLEDH